MWYQGIVSPLNFLYMNFVLNFLCFVMQIAQLSFCPPAAWDKELEDLRLELARIREASKSVILERKELLAFKHAHQGDKAELKKLKQRLAELEEEHTNLELVLNRKKDYAASLEEENKSALETYMGSSEHADDMLKYFTLGFEDSLAKVKELQPSFSTGSILPPNKVIEFRARLKGSSSQSKKNPSTDGVPK